MKHHDSSANKGAVKYPGDAFGSLQPEFEQPITHGAAA